MDELMTFGKYTGLPIKYIIQYDKDHIEFLYSQRHRLNEPKHKHIYNILDLNIDKKKQNENKITKILKELNQENKEQIKIRILEELKSKTYDYRIELLTYIQSNFSIKLEKIRIERQILIIYSKNNKGYTNIIEKIDLLYDLLDFQKVVIDEILFKLIKGGKKVQENEEIEKEKKIYKEKQLTILLEEYKQKDLELYKLVEEIEKIQDTIIKESDYDMKIMKMFESNKNFLLDYKRRYYENTISSEEIEDSSDKSYCIIL